jgi:hypothetical protein
MVVLGTLNDVVGQWAPTALDGSRLRATRGAPSAVTAAQFCNGL